MAKGFLKRLKPQEARVQASESFVDLGALEDAGLISPADGGPAGTLRVAELSQYEDLRDLIDLVYQGTFMIIDFNPIAEDELSMRRVTNELQTAVKDTGGDMVALKRNFLVVSPPGVKIDRKVIKSSVL